VARPGDRVTGVSGSRPSRRAMVRVAGLSGIVAALTAGGLSGCDLDPDTSSQPPEVGPADPDADIVDAARTELRDLLVRLSATSGTGSLVACHRQQLAVLQGHPPAMARGRALTRAQTVARERRAAERFTHWALACHNGDLARILASVAAGIRMQPVLGHAP
jgi:hypothetical protein